VNTTSTTFLIRPIRPDEYEALGQLTVAAYHTISYDIPQHHAYDVQLRDVARRAQTSSVVVATTPAGELLGGVTYVSGPDDPYSEELREGEAGIRMLAVHPAHQCLARARGGGRRRMVLHTGVWMPAAVRMYERMGFVRVPELDFVPVPGVDLIAYSFDLADPTVTPG